MHFGLIESLQSRSTKAQVVVKGQNLSNSTDGLASLLPPQVIFHEIFRQHCRLNFCRHIETVALSKDFDLLEASNHYAVCETSILFGPHYIYYTNALQCLANQ